MAGAAAELTATILACRRGLSPTRDGSPGSFPTNHSRSEFVSLAESGRIAVRGDVDSTTVANAWTARSPSKAVLA